MNRQLRSVRKTHPTGSLDMEKRHVNRIFQPRKLKPLPRQNLFCLDLGPRIVGCDFLAVDSCDNAFSFETVVK